MNKPAIALNIKQAISRAAADLIPSSPGLNTWLSTYVTHHLDRLADDAQIALEMCGGNVSLRIADVGSTPPLVPALLALHNFDVTAIDIDPTRVRLPAHHRVKIAQCNIEDNFATPLPGSHYDVILLNEVVEHLRVAVPQTLRRLYLSLSPSGYIIISTPNLWSYRGMLNFFVAKRAEVLCSRPEIEYMKLDTLGHMGHVREYTPNEIISLIESVGFSFRKIIFRHYPNDDSLIEKGIARVLPRLRNNFAIIAQRQ